jgi:hypothetical protein
MPPIFLSGKLNLGDDFCYQIDTVVLFQTGYFKFF